MVFSLLSLLATSAAAATLAVVPTPSDSRAILQALFAGTKAKIEADGATPVARTKFKQVKIEGEEPKTQSCGAAEVRVLTTVPAREVDAHAPADESFVLTQTTCESQGCHACGAFIGVARMKRAGERWSKLGDYKFRLEIGQWGDESQVPEVVRLSPQAVALRYDGASMGQGYVESACNLFALEADGRLRWVAQILETTSNEGTCDEKDTPPRPCYEKKFQVALSKKTTNGWHDLEVRVTGRDLDDKGKLVDVNRVDRYRYDGKKYQPVKR